GLGDLVFGDFDVLAGGVGEDDQLAFLAALEAGDVAAIFEGEDGIEEGGIDVAVGVEDVFDDAIQAAGGDAVELRADVGAFAFDGMTDGAIGGENQRAFFGRGGGGFISYSALVD